MIREDRVFSRRAALVASGAALAMAARNAHAQSATYGYDALGRLTSVTYPNGTVVTNTYDEAGNRIQVQTGSTSSAFNATIQITGTGPVNLRTLADTAGYNGAQNAIVLFVIASGVTISGSAGTPTGGIGIDSGTWPTSSYNIALTLQVLGKAYGGGGAGGSGNSGAGNVGGDALYCRLPMSVVVNSGGEIGAGGGGGGGGGRGRVNQGGEIFIYGGGGGGGGAPNGPGGAGGVAADGNGSPGSAGTVSGGGSGGASSGGQGGNGAAFGATGTAGDNAWQAGGAGGAAGYAIRKNGHAVMMSNNGSVAGAVG